jgi:hypothetical protein
MPGPKPTPSTHYFWTDPKTWTLLGVIIALACAVAYFLLR